MSDAQDRGWGPPCPTSEITSISAGGRTFNVHRKVTKIFETFITELVERGYPINKGTLDDWSYNCRKIAGSTTWSNHAWGLAVDINSLTNPMTSPLTTDMPSWVRNEQDLLARYGLRWGGEYSGTPDPMHYEFMLAPADADRISATLDSGEWWQMPIGDAELKQIRQVVFEALNWPPPSEVQRKGGSVANQTYYINAKADTTLANQGQFATALPELADDEEKIINALALATSKIVKTIEDNAGQPMTDEQIKALGEQLAQELINSDLPAAFVEAFGEALLDSPARGS